MKTVLILGAYSDIGEAIAKKFAIENYKLILGGRNLFALRRLGQEISIKYNIPVQTHQFDAFDYNSHQAYYSMLEEKPDVSVCVFGYLGDQKLAENDWSESERIIGANYLGTVSILNIIANDYERRGGGVIIGISSVAGERGRKSNYIYGSAKGAFSIFLDGMRNRLSKTNVHVMSVKPGFVDTKMTEHLNLPPALTASPEQVAEKIFKGYSQNKDTIYVLPIWQYIMFVIKLIPEQIFKKLNL